MMKKITLGLAVIGLTACATTTNAGNGLIRLESEPKNCEYLYSLDSSVTNYKITDAYDYVEKTILEQKDYGDSYYIAEQNVVDNPGAIFGPEHTYKFKIKVYNCKK